MALRNVSRVTAIGVAFVFSCFFQGTLTSDVPDDTVYTDGQKTVRMGDSVVLTCRFRGSPLAVYWKKGDDPRRAPNLVSWIPIDDVMGKCEGQRPCEIMEMNEDRSLVIKEVSIAEEGRYICRVANYKGNLIHNFTDIRVFSPPSEPYPRIEECPGVHVNNALQSCRLPAFDSVTITCTASKYFPEIDLFFLHESITTNVTYPHTGIETNVDGTKNKSVSIVARPSENPYVCVASRIPGSKDRRTVSVTVYPTVAKTTTQTYQTTPPRQRHEVVVLLIPIVLVVVLVCVIIWLYRKRRASNYGDLESSPDMPDMKDIKGKVSFYELWRLVHHTETKYSERLREVLIYLNICQAEDELTADKVYNLLCQWKDANTYDDEATVLENAFIRHGLKRSWKLLCEWRYATTYVPDKSLNRILWNVRGEIQIRIFFCELLHDTPEAQLEWHGNKSDGIKDATNFLRQWCDKKHEVNQNVKLSLALERAKFKPLDRTFFEG